MQRRGEISLTLLTLVLYCSGVAVGSSIGHAIGGLFGGGGSSSAAPAADNSTATNAASAAAAYDNNNDNANNSNGWGGAASNCEGSAKDFTKCMDDHKGNMQICNWYLEQLVRFLLSFPSPAPFFFFLTLFFLQ